MSSRIIILSCDVVNKPQQVSNKTEDRVSYFFYGILHLFEILMVIKIDNKSFRCLPKIEFGSTLW